MGIFFCVLVRVIYIGVKGLMFLNIFKSLEYFGVNFNYNNIC